MRALATSHPHTPYRVFSGSNDRTVRVWDILSLETGAKQDRTMVLRGHSHWVRALECCSRGERLCSAAKEVRVWDATKLTLMYTLPVGEWVYSLAICRVSSGAVDRDTLYAGTSKGKIATWRLGSSASLCSELAVGSDGPVRALCVNKAVLYAGGSDGRLHTRDLGKGRVTGAPAAHTAGVRCVAVDPIAGTVYTAADDRSIRVWSEPADDKHD